jgi:CIC family chloride channel protein
MIRAFHEGAGVVRARVIPLKALASLFTLGSGGAGGREGPTMLIGAAIGSNVARLLGLSAREQRILLVAGVAGGISAVFRTPLGAALLAVEILYRDGFESDALIPALLASVVSYSVVITIFGESILLSHAPRFPFVPAHLPLYVLLALLVAVLALGFSRSLRAVRAFSLRLRMPDALRPALGGLVLGGFATLIVTGLAGVTGRVGQGLGVLGGGYGAAQMAVTGSAFLPTGWQGVQVLALLCLAKLLAASVTIGSGGSAGDFAPSLAMGALLGGAFGRAAQLVLGDPRIDPGAFALVGMGTFYGGIAHVPLSALVLVCELAGNYDLLVPLMLSLGIAFIGLRRHGLYDAQVATQQHSPVYRDGVLKDVLRGMRVSEVMRAPPAEAQQAADGSVPAPTVRHDQDLLRAAELLVGSGGRSLAVVDQSGQVVGCLDEADVARAYLQKATRGPVTR